MGAIVPFDLQRRAALHGRPGVAGHHSHTPQRQENRSAREPWNLHHLQHTGHGQGLGGVHAAQFAAHHGWARDHRVNHARQPHVHPVGGLAFADGLQVHHSHAAFADVAKFGGRFELECVGDRHRLFCGLSGQLAIPQAAAAGLVQYLVLHSLHL